MMICFIPTLTSHRNDFVSVVKFPLIYSLFSCICDFQPFSSHGTHKLITKILWHTKKYIFCQSDKKIGIILIHSHWTAVVVLATATFYLTV